MGELFAHSRLRDAVMERVPLDEPEATRFSLSPGDLLFARQSLVLSGAGKCSIFVGDAEPVTFESHVIRVRLDTTVADPLYYFYYYQSRAGRSAIESIVEQGAGASGIRASDLARLQVPRPSLTRQQRVGRILAALDDKIELNRRMTETLEATARALFKSWFVDFDPVRAKAEGHDPGVPTSIADHFPASLATAERREYPTGWRIGSLYEISDVVYGAPFASSLFNSEQAGEPLLRIRDLATESPGVWTTEVLDRGYRVEPGDVVVGMDGEFRAYVWGGATAWLNQRLCVFQPKEGYSAAFVRGSITALLAEVEATETATTVIHLGKSDIDRFRVVVPPLRVVEAFSAVGQPLYDRLVLAKQEARTLAAMRDALLPKLLSGELRIGDAELAVEAVRT